MSVAASESRRLRGGVAYAAAAFAWWGVSPIYWKAMPGVPAFELLANRIVWSFLLLVVVLAAGRRGEEVRALLGNRRALLTLVATTALIAANWFTYIWAMGAGRVLESSLGYFVNPLVNVLLGIVFLGERLRRAQGWAVALAAAGVAVLTWHNGRVPWVALALAATFGLYGLLRKTVQAGPEVGLAMETALLTPWMLAWLLYHGAQRRCRLSRRRPRPAGAGGRQRRDHRRAAGVVHPRRPPPAAVHRRPAAVHLADRPVPARGAGLRRALLGRPPRRLPLHLVRPGDLHLGPAAGAGAAAYNPTATKRSRRSIVALHRAVLSFLLTADVGGHPSMPGDHPPS